MYFNLIFVCFPQTTKWFDTELLNLQYILVLKETCLAKRLSSKKIDSAFRVQKLDKAVSQSTRRKILD